MEMRGKTNSIQLGIEILTPVQCGSGQELFKELDYVKKDQQVFVVDQIKSFNAIASGEQALDNLLVGGSSQLSDLVQLAGEHYGYRLPMIVGSGVVPDKIREHLKDAHFQPYLAGSALKGAIRTALIAEYLRSPNNVNYQRFLPNTNNKPKDRFADDKLLDNLLGKEPKQHIFRALHVKDAMFKTEQLCLVDIRWLNLVGQANKETAHWRSMEKKRSFPRWQDGDGIHAEMLKPKSTASFHLQWDEFLLSDLSQWHGKAQNDILPCDFASLRNTLNAHTRHRLTQEIAFYHRYGALKPEQECQILLNRLVKDPNSIYLQLSWGSGWRGMTGDWLNDDSANAMRTLYRLGRDTMPFPKTRRLAVLGEPKLPLGWVRLFSQTHIADNPEPSETMQAPQKTDNTNPSVLEKELQALKKIPEREWDSRLFQKLEQARWASEDKKQVAEKIKQLMINADKWCPEYTGTDKDKIKYKKRSLDVLKFLNL
jgi:CRISPR type III-A-associated RAMP protein Csm5